jgi:hypothetical protein
LTDLDRSVLELWHSTRRSENGMGKQENQDSDRGQVSGTISNMERFNDEISQIPLADRLEVVRQVVANRRED